MQEQKLPECVELLTGQCAIGDDNSDIKVIVQILTLWVISDTPIHSVMKLFLCKFLVHWPPEGVEKIFWEDSWGSCFLFSMIPPN